MSTRNRREGQRLGWRGLFGLTAVGAFAILLLFAGIGGFHTHSVLAERGVVVTATIVEIGNKGSITVRFGTARGEQIQTVIRNAPSGLVVGGPVPVRYDPADPAHLVETVRDDQAAMTRWFELLSGAALLGLVVFGLVWWALSRGRRRPGQAWR